MSVNISPRRQALSHQRDVMYSELESVLEDEADPLAAYDNLVKWTLQNYANHSDTGLLELLEETVRRFKDDMRYKPGDLRYVKLWILFANHVDKPATIYTYMMENGIGKPYSLFFEEYAEALEREGRFVEAETVMTLGIRTQSKPLKHLQQFQQDFHTRRATGKSLPRKVSPFREGTCSAGLMAIRIDPLKNIAPRRPGSAQPSALSVPSYAGQHDVSMTTTQAMQSTVPVRPNPYAHLNAPPAPGKKPEQLRFDLTLLLEPDGTEYCFEEARARHLGLLGKKWPPPPPPNAAASSSRAAPGRDSIAREGSVKVDFNDNGSKVARPPRRQSVTVTINTKQALEDVFDMYNSPVKEEPGIEEAVLIKPRPIETPGLLQTPGPTASRPPVFQDENAGVATTKPRAFQPYVDQRRENVTPGAPKFKASTNKTPRSNAFTPNVLRKALVSKDLVTPVPAFKVVRPHQASVISEQKLHAEAKGDIKGIDVFGDDVTADEFTEELTQPPPPPPPPRSFVPFVDENTDNAALPAPRSENPSALSTSTSKILKFQVHRDENAPQPPAIGRPMGGERTPAQLIFKPTHQEEQTPLDGNEAPQRDDDIEDDYQGVEDRQRFARSERFANFDVMTPITERTFEFTTSTRAIGTPASDHISLLDRGFVASEAHDGDENTTPELQDEGTTDQEWRTAEDTKDEGPVALLGPEIMGAAGADESVSKDAFTSFEQIRAPFRVSDGFTIEPNQSNLLSSAIVIQSTSTNLAQVLVRQPGLELPNPCNPSDPDIVSTIISSFPVEPDHQDLQHRVANHLNIMHRFAEKRSRRGSGASNSSRVSDGTDGLRLDLNGDLFEVFDKLGEGGFGAVFMAKDLTKPRHQEDEDNGDDEDDDGMVAVKAVRPTNLWESYVLRRIISAVPEDLRRSIIRPHRLYAFKDESFLILDLCQQGTLMEIVNRATMIGIGQPGGGLDELLAMFFTVELLRVLQGLHDRGFIHGDLKIENCLIRLEEVPGGTSAWSSEYSPSGAGGWANKGIKLIDFGRTIDMSLYPAGQTFVADWKTDARDCVEMRQGRPWTFQTDYAGLASIIYCMLFGKYIEPVEVEGKVKPPQAMKRYWQADLWNRLFDALLNPCQLRPDGSLPITDELAALRQELERWMQGNCNKAGKNLKGMLKKIEIASLNRISRK